MVVVIPVIIAGIGMYLEMGDLKNSSRFAYCVAIIVAIYVARWAEVKW